MTRARYDEIWDRLQECDGIEAIELLDEISEMVQLEDCLELPDHEVFQKDSTHAEPHD